MSDGNGQFPVVLWRTGISEGEATATQATAGEKTYQGGQKPLSVTPGSRLTVEQLKKTCDIYKDNEGEWKFLAASYDGARALANGGYISQYERESEDNYNRRVDELYGFGYTKSIVDLLTFYLFSRESRRDMGPIEEGDNAWKEFLEDCDLDGTSFDVYLLDRARQASIYGHVGILVDRSGQQFENREQEIHAGVYPYLATYLPPSILDWEYRRDANGRPHLEYLKLKDDDGFYRLWWRGSWEKWGETKKANGSGQTEAELIESGTYPLADIPFVWLYCLRTGMRGLGLSDVHDVARIDRSIVCNLSQCEEVTKYSAFPMLIEPERPVQIRATGGAMPGPAGATVEVGPRSVLVKDPNLPNSAPEWLDSPSSVDGILKLIERKIAEIYRASNAGGMASTELSTEAKSGAALRAEFQLLGAKLASKSINVERAEKDVIYYWLSWQLMFSPELWDQIVIERPRKFDVEDLAADLENMLSASAIVQSSKFCQLLQKAVARRLLPTAPTAQMAEIDAEIEVAPDFAFRPQRIVQYVPSAEEELKIAGKELELEKAEADAERAKVEAEIKAKAEAETRGAGEAEETANAKEALEERTRSSKGSSSVPAPFKKGVK